MGVEKLRITGGEPLVRRGVDELIARSRAVPGIRDVTLTTNGSLLARMAQTLADAGLRPRHGLASTRSTTRPSAR